MNTFIIACVLAVLGVVGHLLKKPIGKRYFKYNLIGGISDYVLAASCFAFVVYIEVAVHPYLAGVFCIFSALWVADGTRQIRRALYEVEL